MDGLKRINDRCGHHAGDLALAAIGRVLRDATREHDVVARYGGDEFAVLLPDTDERAAAAVARRIVELAARQPPVGDDMPVRCSVGASTFDPRACAGVGAEAIPTIAELLVRNADAAQYEAKRAGGGRVGTNLPTRAP